MIPEDDQRKRAGNAPQNFSIINRMALSALKQEHTVKLGIKSKRLNAGSNEILMRGPCCGGGINIAVADMSEVKRKPK